MSVSSDGSYITTGAMYDDKVYFFNKEGKLLWSYKTGGQVFGIVSSDGSYIAAGSDDGKVYFFNREGKLLWSYETESDFYDLYAEGKLLQRNEIRGVNDVSISSDGSYVAAVSRIGSVYFFNREGKLLWNYTPDIKPHSLLLNSVVSVSSDGSYIGVGVSSGDIRNIYFFNKDGKLLWSYENYLGIMVSSDGSYIATESITESSDLPIFEINFFNREGKLLWSQKTDGLVNSISISSDGSYIAAGSVNGKVYFFNREGKLLWSHKTDGWVTVSVSSNGSHIAVGSFEGVFFLNREGEFLWTYKPEGNHTDYAASVSSDGQYIVAWAWSDKFLFFGNATITTSPVTSTDVPIPTSTATLTSTTTPTATAYSIEKVTPRTPGFEAVSVVAGILIAVYVFRRNKNLF